MKNSFSKLTYNELISKREELRKDYFQMRVEKVTGHVDNPLQTRNIKRQIARLNTLITEYDMGIRKAE